MAGIYIHIPYCIQKCHYCDFFKTTSLSSKHEFLSALQREIQLQSQYLDGREVQTIYFGGGTPSVLRISEIDQILDSLYEFHFISQHAEITLEANPDDLNTRFINDLRQSRVNRISMGIQSFDNVQLKALNRRHSSEQALTAVKECQNQGFDNISIDLIYGLPGMSLSDWEKQIDKALSLNVQHISSYHLTFETNTVFGDRKKAGILKEIPDQESEQQFHLLVEKLQAANFEHYEISNFAKSGFYSKHNSSYWQQKPYLGLGPSAHSYNLKSRQWNERSLMKYLNELEQNQIPFQSEDLNKPTRFNEYLMTTLRTTWGAKKAYIKSEFGTNFLTYLEEKLLKPDFGNYFDEDKETIRIKQSFWFVSDHILAEVFWVE